LKIIEFDCATCHYNRRLTVYNMLGQQVESLLNETRAAGHHEVTFDASRLSSGALLLRIEAGEYVDTRQMMLVK